MATQGVLSVIQKGSVIVKLVTGSDGYQLPKLAEIVLEKRLINPSDIYIEAEKLEIGSVGSLYVLYTESRFLTTGYDVPPQSYFDTFSNPTWNPRWEDGTADFVLTVDLDKDEIWSKHGRRN